ncbi:MAG: imidazole glycerol phosphate synthase subunit HisH [Desulfuromonas thiophila]|nr:imidazole glycerol phosphate synthase subunit HisH [Desulfuromonas thiophila]
MITIVDYGMGNLRSVQKAFEHLGFSASVSADPRAIERAERLVLPGVGAFRDCMAQLRQGGFIDPIRQHVASGRPFLGICLGMQVLLSRSSEFGCHEGLGLIAGEVVRFPADMRQDGAALKVPHMGWNRLRLQRDCPLLKGVADGSYVYFVHSYYVAPHDPAAVLTTTDYGVEFCSALWRDNLMATQFHPEKSQAVGLRILQNFGEL